jgi:hypothetical protein
MMLPPGVVRTRPALLMAGMESPDLSANALADLRTPAAQTFVHCWRMIARWPSVGVPKSDAANRRAAFGMCGSGCSSERYGAHHKRHPRRGQDPIDLSGGAGGASGGGRARDARE